MHARVCCCHFIDSSGMATARGTHGSRWAVCVFALACSCLSFRPGPCQAHLHDCMPVDYQCITLPVHGRFNGRVLRVLPKTLAPGGSNWLPNACAMECAASTECVYWLVRPPPDNKCVLKSKKGSRFVADAADVHGDRDDLCAKTRCGAADGAAGTTVPMPGGTTVKQLQACVCSPNILDGFTAAVVGYRPSGQSNIADYRSAGEVASGAQCAAKCT